MIAETINRPQTLSITLADPDEAYCNKLQQLFANSPSFDLSVVRLDQSESGFAEHGQQSDVLLLSASEQPNETLAMIERVQSGEAKSKVILLVLLENQEFFIRAVRAGCRGILHKDSTDELLMKCIQKVGEGELWLDRATTAQVLRQLTAERPHTMVKARDTKNGALSPREKEIVGWVMQGYRNRELAEKLTISEQTVKNHMHNIFDKLGVSDRLELALFAIHNNLLKPQVH